MQTKTSERYFFFALLFFTLAFTFFIFQPFWIVLVLGVSFAIVLLPLKRWLVRCKLSNWLASFVAVAIFVLLVCGPMLGLGALVFNQSQRVYHSVADGQMITPFLDRANASINDLLPNGFSFNLNEKISAFVSMLSGNIAKLFSATLSTVFSFILLLLSIFYFLKDGPQWKKSITSLTPMSGEDAHRIVERLKQTVSGVIQGSLLVSLIQGLVMGVGLTLFGVPNPALWGVVAAIASLIPTFGTALVSIPAVIFLYATGHLPEAIGLAIWAAGFVGLIDNFLSPVIVGKKIQISQFLILFSVLGGIALLGPIGILIGPLAVSLLYTLVSIYQNEFKQNTAL